MCFFLEFDNLILKFYRKSKEPRTVKTILKKNIVGGFTLLHFNIYYKARAIKAVWYWEKNRQIYQMEQNRESGKRHKQKNT